MRVVLNVILLVLNYYFFFHAASGGPPHLLQDIGVLISQKSLQAENQI